MSLIWNYDKRREEHNSRGKEGRGEKQGRREERGEEERREQGREKGEERMG